MNDTIVQLKHAHSPVNGDEPLHYTQCGLDNIYLVSGYVQRQVGDETYVAVKDVDDLHDSIALCLMRKKALTGKEIRFLRKNLELTQRELSEFLQVSDQTIARYEKDKTPMDGPVDGLFRLLVLGKLAGAIDVREELEKLREEDDVSCERLTLQRHHDEWRVAAAA